MLGPGMSANRLVEGRSRVFEGKRAVLPSETRAQHTKRKPSRPRRYIIFRLCFGFAADRPSAGRCAGRGKHACEGDEDPRGQNAGGWRGNWGSSGRGAAREVDVGAAPPPPRRECQEVVAI